MDPGQYCRVCLATDVKMYDLHTENIGEIYSNIIEMQVYSDDPQHVCFECTRMLLKYDRFKTKCIEAHNILTKIACKGKKVTKQVLNNINREPGKFETNLTFSPIVVDSFDSTNGSINENNDDSNDMYENEIFKPETLVIPLDTSDDTMLYDHQDDDDLEDVPLKELQSRLNKWTSLHSVSNAILKNVNKILPNDKMLRKQRNTSLATSNLKREASEELSDDPPKKKKGWNRGNTTKYGGALQSTEDYTVIWMTPEDAVADLLQRKETENYLLSPYKCDYCFKGYELLKPFQNHMEKHSESSGEHECDLCHLRFHQRQLLRNHVLCVHERRFNCNHCSYVSMYTQQARDHAKSHKTKFPCKVCGKLYGAPHSLFNHMKTQHSELVAETVCEFCGNIFSSEAGLSMHKRRIHTQELNEKQGPECEICDVHFASESAWKLHLVLSTKHETCNGCKVCGERFSTAAELREHMKTHETRRKRENIRYKVQHDVTCTECGEEFTSVRVYRSHVKERHAARAGSLLARDAARVPVNKPYVCELCGTRFPNPATLRYHMRKHTGERPYKCTECGKGFNMNFQLAAHATVHTKRDTRACDQCGRLLANKSALRKHILAAHLNRRPHKCLLCDKRFVFMCDMKTHIKYSHDKVPYPKKKPAASRTEK